MDLMKILKDMYFGFRLQDQFSVGSSLVHRGDFNVVRFPHEKRGGKRVTRSIEKFSEFINGKELLDMPLVWEKV